MSTKGSGEFAHLNARNIHTNGSALKILVIACAQKPHFNGLADIFSEARGIKFGLRLHLCCVYASTEGSAESAQLRRLARTFDAQHYDKFQNCICWLRIRLRMTRNTDQPLTPRGRDTSTKVRQLVAHTYKTKIAE